MAMRERSWALVEHGARVAFIPLRWGRRQLGGALRPWVCPPPTPPTEAADLLGGCPLHVQDHTLMVKDM